MKSILLLSTLILLVACQPVTNSTDRGRLTIVFQNGSRTVVPSDATLQEFKEKIDRYVVVLSNAETGESRQEASLSGDESVSFANLPDGTWGISGAAVDTNNTTLAEGSATVTVENGQTETVVVKLSATQKGTGQFRFDFSLSDDLGVESVRATLISGSDETSITLVRGEEGGLHVDEDKNLLNATVQTTNFNEDWVRVSGTYLLRLDFLAGGGQLLGSHFEAVNIWDDIVSAAWLGADGNLHDKRVFTSLDLASSNALPKSLELNDGESVLTFSTSTFQYALPGTGKMTILGRPLIDGQLMEASLGDEPFSRLTWDTSHEFDLTNVERLALRFTAPDRQTFVDYVWGLSKSATLPTSQSFRPAGLTGDQYGNLYVVDRGAVDDKEVLVGGGRIIKIDALGNETVYAGDGTLEYDDGSASTASFTTPYGIARDDAGNLYVTEDIDSGGGRLRKVAVDGQVTTLATGLTRPSGVAVSKDGSRIYVVQRKAGGAGEIVQFNASGISQGQVLGGLSNPDAVALSPDETYIAVGANDNTVRKVILASKVASVVATPGSYTYGVTIDPAGNIYCCIVLGHRIVRITAPEVYTTVIGSGTAGATDGVGSAATLYDAWQIWRSPYTGVFYFTERGSKKIRSFQ